MEMGWLRLPRSGLGRIHGPFIPTASVRWSRSIVLVLGGAVLLGPLESGVASRVGYELARRWRWIVVCGGLFSIVQMSTGSSAPGLYLDLLGCENLPISRFIGSGIVSYGVIFTNYQT